MLFPGDDGTQARVLLQRIPDGQFLGSGGQLLDDLVVDRSLDQQPGAGCAHFAFPIKDPRVRAPNGCRDIGVGKDDVGAFATELQGQSLQRVGCLAHDHASHFGGPGERDLVHVRMTDQCGPRRGAVSRHDVERASGQTRLLHDLRHGKRRERRFLGGFQDYGASRRERRGEFPRRRIEREVPRDDGADDAHRLTARVREVGPADRQRIPGDLVRPAGVIPEHGDRGRHIDLGFEQDLPVLPRLEVGEVLPPSLEQVSRARQHRTSGARVQLLPLVALEASPRGGNGSIDIIHATERHRG